MTDVPRLVLAEVAEDVPSLHPELHSLLVDARPKTGMLASGLIPMVWFSLVLVASSDMVAFCFSDSVDFYFGAMYLYSSPEKPDIRRFRQLVSHAFSALCSKLAVFRAFVKQIYIERPSGAFTLLNRHPVTSITQAREDYISRLIGCGEGSVDTSELDPSAPLATYCCFPAGIALSISRFDNFRLMEARNTALKMGDTLEKGNKEKDRRKRLSKCIVRFLVFPPYLSSSCVIPTVLDVKYYDAVIPQTRDWVRCLFMLMAETRKEKTGRCWRNEVVSTLSSLGFSAAAGTVSGVLGASRKLSTTSLAVGYGFVNSCPSCANLGIEKTLGGYRRSTEDCSEPAQSPRSSRAPFPPVFKQQRSRDSRFWKSMRSYGREAEDVFGSKKKMVSNVCMSLILTRNLGSSMFEIRGHCRTSPV